MQRRRPRGGRHHPCRRGRATLGVELGAYGGFAVAFGVASVARRRETWRLLPRVITAFPALHLGYGLGMARGLVVGAPENPPSVRGR